MEINVVVLFFSFGTFKDLVPLSSAVHCPWQEFYCHLCLCFYCIVCLLSLAALKVFFLSLILINFIKICLGSIILFMFLVLGICYPSWIFGFVFFNQIWNVFDHISSNMLSFGDPNYIFFGCLKSHSSMMLCLFFFLRYFFSLRFILGSFYYYVGKSTNHSSAVCNLLLIPSTVFFILDIMVFISRISNRVFKNIYLWCPYLIHSIVPIAFWI